MHNKKEKIKASFSYSAQHYDRYAEVQNEMLEKLCWLLEGDFNNILDIGAGTGTLARMLAKKYPQAKITALDIAPGMVEIALAKGKDKRLSFLLGDGEELPFISGAFDLIVSNASLQWMDAGKVFAEAARVLQPNGQFCFSTFGPATLRELKEAGLSVNNFPTAQGLKKMLLRYFQRGELTQKIITKTYRDIFELFASLTRTGAQLPNKVSNKGLCSRKKLKFLFPPQLAISYELIFGNYIA